ncbi:hypothetical protein LIER_16326 [Lithospermum erythrorhizon]|uniref:Uncharacterized protein n=1 Tax=Lithospermum erythrorhizon TaxID=34254 RepID=A0AAV3Q8S7_LITER
MPRVEIQNSYSKTTSLTPETLVHIWIRIYFDTMSIKPTVALRAILVGGVAAFAKIAGAVKAAGGAKLGTAAAAMAAATAAMSKPKQEQQDASIQTPK